MTKQMQALLIIARHPRMKAIFDDAIDVERETFHIARINYGVLSGGEKTLVSWAWCIWNDAQVPGDNGGYPGRTFNLLDGVRDPFEGFGVLDPEFQVLVLRSLIYRWS